MDVQTVCLGLLTEEDRSGYEIKKQLEDGPLGNFVDASFGSIYPALTRLTEEGLVEFRTEEQDGRPDKKIYSITDKGLDTFRAALGKPTAPDRFKSDFLFSMWFAELLEPRQLSQMLDDRIATFEQKIAEIEEKRLEGKALGPDFVAGQALAIYTAAKAYLEQNRHLIEETTETETDKPATQAAAGGN